MADSRLEDTGGGVYEGFKYPECMLVIEETRSLVGNGIL